MLSLIGVTFDNLSGTAGTSKKPCPAGFFDDNSSNNLTIEVGTHPGGWEDLLPGLFGSNFIHAEEPSDNGDVMRREVGIPVYR